MVASQRLRARGDSGDTGETGWPLATGQSLWSSRAHRSHTRPRPPPLPLAIEMRSTAGLALTLTYARRKRAAENLDNANPLVQLTRHPDEKNPPCPFSTHVTRKWRTLRPLDLFPPARPLRE
jgi:hypothetical protein